MIKAGHEGGVYMSENNHEELFKTTLMGGFDKDDVMTKCRT